MFEIGERLSVNLGANGTHTGVLVSEENGGQKLIIALDEPTDSGKWIAEVAPWDVFPIEEETE